MIRLARAAARTLAYLAALVVWPHHYQLVAVVTDGRGDRRPMAVSLPHDIDHALAIRRSYIVLADTSTAPVVMSVAARRKAGIPWIH